MRVTRWGKAVGYLLLTAGLMTAAGILQQPMHTEAGLVAGYFRTVGFLFLLACCLLGGSLYSYRAYTHRHREHLFDNVFLLLIGLAAMISALVLFLQYGGMGEEVTRHTYTAARACVIILSLLPVPFISRTLTLAFTSQQEKLIPRRVVQLLAVMLLLAWIALVVSGVYLNTIDYPKTGYSFQAEYL